LGGDNFFHFSIFHLIFILGFRLSLPQEGGKGLAVVSIGSLEDI
jgi:hypothetical protein